MAHGALVEIIILGAKALRITIVILKNSIKKAKEKFGKFKLGSPRNFSIFVIIAVLLWLATGFYRVEPDEQGVELLFGKWNGVTTSNQDFIISFQDLLDRQ